MQGHDALTGCEHAVAGPVYHHGCRLYLPYTLYACTPQAPCLLQLGWVSNTLAVQPICSTGRAVSLCDTDKYAPTNQRPTLCRHQVICYRKLIWLGCTWRCAAGVTGWARHQAAAPVLASSPGGAGQPGAGAVCHHHRPQHWFWAARIQPAGH